MVGNHDQPCQNHGKTWSIHGPGAGVNIMLYEQQEKIQSALLDGG